MNAAAESLERRPFAIDEASLDSLNAARGFE
jgi:hypothetical protein